MRVDHSTAFTPILLSTAVSLTIGAMFGPAKVFMILARFTNGAAMLDYLCLMIECQ